MGFVQSRPTQYTKKGQLRVKGDASYRPEKLEKEDCPFSPSRVQYIIGDKRLLMFETDKLKISRIPVPKPTPNPLAARRH